MVTIKKYDPKYKEDVREVCINTGPAAAQTDKKVHDYILFTFCDYYIEQEPENVFVLVDKDDKAQGYIFCAADFKGYAKRFKPYLKKLRKINFKYYAEALGEVFVYRLYSKKYPAHLHIDLNKPLRGGGNGSKMMETLVSHMKAKGVNGIMLIVGTENKRGINFYWKNGFKILRRFGGGTAMAKEL